MSLLGKIADFGRKVLGSPVAQTIAPILPPAIGGAITAYGIYQGVKGATAPQPVQPQVMQFPSLPGAGYTGAGMLSPGSIAAGGRVVMGAVRAVPKAAANLCRKYPQWCATIGGTAAVEAMIHAGQLPMPKRRRTKGISGHELKAFRRVARFTSKYCAPVHRAMKAPAMRRKGGLSCR